MFRWRSILKYYENLYIILGIAEMARGTATVAEISLQFIVRLKSFRVGALLSELDNLDHNIGPKYLMECLSYFIVRVSEAMWL